jgi:hypothetical protein
MTTVHQLPNAIQQPDGTWTKEIELEEMIGEDEDILADRRTAPGGKGKMLKTGPMRMSEILSRCTVRIGTATRPDGKDRFSAPNHFLQSWKQAYVNDRGFAVIRLREMSLGSDYTFTAVCPTCSREVEGVSVDLSTLEVTSKPVELVSKETHTLTLPSGKVCVWKMLRGVDEDMLEEVMEERKADLVTALQQLRVVSLDGEPRTVQSLARLTTKDRRAIAAAYQEVEGGIDTLVSPITCDNPSCGRQFASRVNVGSSGFFFPSAAH